MDTFNIGHAIIGVGVGLIATAYPAYLIRRAERWAARRIFGSAA